MHTGLVRSLRLVSLTQTMCGATQLSHHTEMQIIGVQGAERRVPINYASRYRSSGNLARASYLPFKVNATGVMPVIFSTSLLAVPGAIVKFSGVDSLQGVAAALSPGGALYLPTNVVLIVAINYYYTFLQLDPNDVSDQLKRQVCGKPPLHDRTRCQRLQ
jgi:protein transport protein SEC61 subunit alpha